MLQLPFQPIDPQSIAALYPAIAEAIHPATLDLNQAMVEMAELPFYDNYRLYAITDLRLPTGEIYELLCGPDGAFLLDGSNQPIYRVNDLAPIRLTRETLPPYLRFFARYAAVQDGSIIIAESAEDIPWLPDADKEVIDEATAKLQPLTLVEYQADDLCVLNATILVLDVLFKVGLQIAPCRLTWEGDESDSMEAGAIRPVNLEVLMHGLPVEFDEELEETDAEEGIKNVPSDFALYEPFPAAAGFNFHEQPEDFTTQLVTAMPEEIRPQASSEDGFTLTVADLSFYPNVCLAALTDPALPGNNVRFFLSQKDFTGRIFPMNKTNEPIYDFNNEETLLLTPVTMPLYARFFFFLVQGQLGRFIIVERPEDVAWQPEATGKDKKAVNELLMPATYIGLDDQGLHTLKATVVFHNALFRTEIKIAPQAMEVRNHETNEIENFSLGQMQLANEEVLLEDLPVVVAS